MGRACEDPRGCRQPAFVVATVLLSLWQLGMESLQLSGLSAQERVQASGKPSSALGEGLADALNVGGY